LADQKDWDDHLATPDRLKAVARSSAAASTQNNLAIAYYNRIAYQKAHHAKAIAGSNQSIRLNTSIRRLPQSPSLRRPAFDLAIDDYNHPSSSPDYAHLHDRGWTYAAKQVHARAQRLQSRCRADRTIMISTTMRQLLCQLGDLDKALAGFDKAITLKPARPPTRLDLGAARRACGPSPNIARRSAGAGQPAI
jgi:tetratricopeptide (TPR) repeat protein